jgi:lipopolysaccharide export system permease protein
MTKFNASFSDILMFDIIKSPIFIYQTLPVSFVVAMVATFIILIRHNELAAFLSIGGNLFSFLTTLMFMATIFGFLTFFMADHIVPQVQERSEKFKTLHIERKEKLTIPSISNFWFKDKEKLIKIGTIDIIKRKMYEIEIFNITPAGDITSVNYIEDASYVKDSTWFYKNVKILDLTDIPKLSKKIDRLAENNDTLTRLLICSKSTSPKELTMSDLSKIITLYKSKGLNYSSYALYYYNKISYASAVIILTLMLLPYIVEISKGFSYIRVATIAIILIVGFWVLLSACMSLGKSGALNPIAANFLPHLTGMLVAAYGYYLKRDLFGI